MKQRSLAGFTLLEVLLATSIMAVGTTSVLVVIATSAGMASQRQVNLRREQVLDEARHEAQAIVDAWRPNKQAAAPAAKSAKSAKGGKADASPDIGPPKIEEKQSSRFAGFTYDLSFTPQDRQIPEKGYQVAITVHYGGGELSTSTTATMISTTIPDEEFTTSTTWDEERLAGGGQKQTGAQNK